MSLDPPASVPSPLSSGRSSPQLRRRIDEDATKKDPKYKRYSANVDRALGLFDSSTLQEWADYISFLGRLLKALQSHPSLPLVPSKHLVAQRLAQCLKPTLPSGVHQKTVEVYSYIFSLIGRDGLANDLPLWTPGLMPVLSYASLTLKPHYLNLLETFYLPLDKSLRPALKSLILALLPGIDEEGGEYFDRTLALIDGIRDGVEDHPYFWQCFLLATITASGRRQGALGYLVRRLPKMGEAPKIGEAPKGDGATVVSADSLDGATSSTVMEDMEAVINPEPGLLVRAFCAGLNDEQLLVQRGFLDLLVTHMPLSSSLLQHKVSKADLQLLITSAAGVVLRRDMSLNRRLWAWFLGADEAIARKYFGDNGLSGLVAGLKQMVDHRDEASPIERATPIERARPYRICLSLMDRTEIGTQVVPKFFRPAIESLKLYERTAPNKEAYAEVLRSANMFFDATPATLIWAHMLERINTAFRNNAAAELDGVQFIISTFNVKEEEMVNVHAPNVILALLELLAMKPEATPKDLSQRSLQLIEQLWAIVPEAAFRQPVSDAKKSNGEARSDRPAEQLLDEASASVKTALENRKVVGNVAIRCRFLVQVIQKLPNLDWDGLNSLVQVFSTSLASENCDFVTIRGIASTVSELCAQGYLSRKTTTIDRLIVPLIKGLWAYLSPDVPKYHVEAVRAVWGLQNVLDDRRIEAAVSLVMTSDNPCDRNAEQGRRFAVLWHHSVNGIAGEKYPMVLTRPLFLVLDSLVEEKDEMAVFARGWLQQLQLQSVNRLLWIFVSKFLGCKFLRDPGPRTVDFALTKRPKFDPDDPLEIVTYYFQTLVNVLKYPTESSLRVLANEPVAGSDEGRMRALDEAGYKQDMTLQVFLALSAMRAVDGDGHPETAERVSKLHRSALGLLSLLLDNPPQISESMADLELEDALIARLISILRTQDAYVQVPLLEVLCAALKLSLARPTSKLAILQAADNNGSRISLSADSEKTLAPTQILPPAQLQRCLVEGFSSASSKLVLESWIAFLQDVLPLVYEVIFQMLIPLVECLCGEIQITFNGLKELYRDGGSTISESGGKNPESTLTALLSGLEQVLAAAHDRLRIEERVQAGPTSPQNSTSGSFFGSMVSGVFSVESPQNRNSAANNRLTVLLCFRDTVRICHSIWSWGDYQTTGSVLDSESRESWAYTSLRMRGRARRILEHMFVAETLECLETLIELWPGKIGGDRNASSIFRLINVLDGSRPKNTMPAIFNAIYSRTNPTALDPSRRSSLTAELLDLDVVTFLVEYARSLEKDAMDEIWADCMVFLKDVLANPFPHRQTLPSLLSFTAILGEKVDETNFGEQKKMRKELADVFLRLLTVAFTTTPVGQRPLEAPAPAARDEKDALADTVSSLPTAGKSRSAPDDIVSILASLLPNLRKVLVDPDRVVSAALEISTRLLGPTFRSKSFPSIVTPSLLDLAYRLTKLPGTQKAWKKEISEAFLDPKFFAASQRSLVPQWVPLARQMILADRERMADLLGRFTTPTTAGVLFGVGATSARYEADRKTQLNLKRMAFLIYAAEMDTFVVTLSNIEDKLVELLSATSTTSPSSVIRSEVFMVIRALALRTSAVHMASFWPLVNSELLAALQSLFPGEKDSTYNDGAVLQACKLLDTLLVLAPDEFQLHEWLYVTDTIEAVYQPTDWDPVAVVDCVAMEMAARGEIHGDGGGARKLPWFRGEGIREGTDVRREVVAPFLSNLSIATYEGTYALEKQESRLCEGDLVKDLFADAV